MGPKSAAKCWREKAWSQSRAVFGVVSDTNSSKYLDGLEIDYSDDLFNGGLKLANANTKSTCGYGSSFSLSGFPEIQGGKCTSEEDT